MFPVGGGEGDRGAWRAVPGAALQRQPRGVAHDGAGMLEKATLHKDVLVKRGMSEQLVGDLAGALGEFAQTIEATRAGRREHPSLRSGQVVGASADLEAVAADDALAGACARRAGGDRFGDNAELMMAWASARNVLEP